MARSNAAEVIGADGYAVRGPVSAAAAVGCALIEIGANQLGWTDAAVSQAGHNHDDRYFTESEITALLTGKVGTTGNWVMAGQLTTNGLVLAPGNALLSSPSADAINFPNGIAMNINSGLPRFFAMNTMTFQSNSGSVQTKFGNEIGATLTGTVVEISGGGAGAGTGAKLLLCTNAFVNVASIDKDGNITGTGAVLSGSLTTVNVTASGTVQGARLRLAPVTNAALTSMTPSAYENWIVAVLDRGDKIAYSDGSFWRWVGTNAKIAEEQVHPLIFGVPEGTTGLLKFPAYIPQAMTITSWELISLDHNPASCVLDVRKAPYASYPPNSGNSIVASAKPTLSSAVKATSSTLTGWSPDLSQGDYVNIIVESLTGGGVLLVLKGVKQ